MCLFLRVGVGVGVGNRVGIKIVIAKFCKPKQAPVEELRVMAHDDFATFRQLLYQGLCKQRKSNDQEENIASRCTRQYRDVA